MNCLPDVECMVWKFLCMSCLKARIHIYLCVPSATFTSCWQPPGPGEAAHAHKHCQGHLHPLAPFLPSPKQTQCSPCHETAHGGASPGSALLCAASQQPRGKGETNGTERKDTTWEVTVTKSHQNKHTRLSQHRF